MRSSAGMTYNGQGANIRLESQMRFSSSLGSFRPAAAGAVSLLVVTGAMQTTATARQAPPHTLEALSGEIVVAATALRDGRTSAMADLRSARGDLASAQALAEEHLRDAAGPGAEASPLLAARVERAVAAMENRVEALDRALADALDTDAPSAAELRKLIGLASPEAPPATALPPAAPRVPQAVPVVQKPDQFVEGLRATMASSSARGSETRLTPELRQLARRLGTRNRIVSWVRSNVLYVPAWGSLQGAEGCRQSLECNAHDTTSLLVALLRATGLRARYVSGLVELRPGFFRAAVGEFDTLEAALRAASFGGLPVAVRESRSGSVRGVVVGHVWAEVRMRSRSRLVWRTVEASLKRSVHTEPADLAAVANIDPDEMLDGLLAETTVDESVPAVTAVDREAVRDSFATTREAFDQWLEGVGPNVTIGEVFGALEPGAMARRTDAKVVRVTDRFTTVPGSQRHRLFVTIPDMRTGDPALVRRFDTAALAGRRLTVAFPAATPEDEAVIDEYGGLYATPPFMVELAPSLMVDGQVHGRGAPIPMGAFQTVLVDVMPPGGPTTRLNHFVRAGGFAAIGHDESRIGPQGLAATQRRLEATLAGLTGPGDLPIDDVVGETLHGLTLVYWQLVDFQARMLAHQLDVRALRAPGGMLASIDPVLRFEGGVPVEITGLSAQVDVKRLGVRGLSRDADPVPEAVFLGALGTFTSVYEHIALELFFEATSTSTTRVIDESLAAGGQVWGLDASNIDTLAGELTLAPNVVENIQLLVQNGFEVFTPPDPTAINQWTGAGWLAQDLATGQFAYLLSGLLSGGATTEQSEGITLLQQGLEDLASEGAELYVEHGDKLKWAGNITKFATPAGAAVEGVMTYSEVYEKTGDSAAAAQAAATNAAIEVGVDVATGALVTATAGVAVAAGGAAVVAATPVVVITVVAVIVAGELVKEGVKNNATAGR